MAFFGKEFTLEVATKATHETSTFMACNARVAWFAPFVAGICRGRPAKTGKKAGAVSAFKIPLYGT